MCPAACPANPAALTCAEWLSGQTQHKGPARSVRVPSAEGALLPVQLSRWTVTHPAVLTGQSCGAWSSQGGTGCPGTFCPSADSPTLAVQAALEQQSARRCCSGDAAPLQGHSHGEQTGKSTIPAAVVWLPAHCENCWLLGWTMAPLKSMCCSCQRTIDQQHDLHWRSTACWLADCFT